MDCQEHEEGITLVCVTCDNKVLCPQCFDDHTKGHDIQSLRKVASRIKQELNDLSESYSQHLSDIPLDIKDTQAQQKEQDTLERQTCDKINAQRQLLHKVIDESSHNLINICKKRKQRNLSALQNREIELSSQYTEITNKQSEIRKLLQSKNLAEIIKTSETIKSMTVEVTPPKHLESLDFLTSLINKQSVDNMMGEMANDDVSCVLGSDFTGSLRNVGGLTAVSTIHSYTFDKATVIHPSLPGHAWVRWYRQNEVQLTDRQGHVTQSVKFNKKITGITTTPDNRLLVCGYTEKCVFQVVYGSEPSVYFRTTIHPRDICITDNGDVIVSLDDADDTTTTRDSRRIVSRYNSKGQHLSDSAEFDRFGDRLFVRPWRLHVNNINSTVTVVNELSESPLSSHLVLLDTSLNLKLRYDGKVTPANKKYTPDTDVNFCILDATFTPEYNILVAEAYSNSILLLDSDCQHLKTLWRDDLWPTALCLHNNGELWCSFYKRNGGVIKVIKQSTRE